MIEVKFSFGNPFCSVDLFDVYEVLFTNITYLHKLLSFYTLRIFAFRLVFVEGQKTEFCLNFSIAWKLYYI